MGGGLMSEEMAAVIAAHLADLNDLLEGIYEMLDNIASGRYD